MKDAPLSDGDKTLRESVVKSAIAAFDWNALKAHLEEIELVKRGDCSQGV